MTRTKDGRFAKGTSGNPKGRARSSLASRVRDRVAGHLDGLVDTLVEKALAGDVAAARVVLERVAPSLRAEEAPVVLNLPADADLAATGRAVLAQAAAGELSPTQAGALLSGLGTLAKVVEVDEILRRVEALEEKANGKS